MSTFTPVPEGHGREPGEGFTWLERALVSLLLCALNVVLLRALHPATFTVGVLSVVLWAWFVCLGLWWVKIGSRS